MEVEEKKEKIGEYNNTGSIEFQVMMINKRINNLAEHLKNNHKDFHSKRALLILVSKRRKFLNYLKRRKSPEYDKLIKAIKEKNV